MKYVRECRALAMSMVLTVAFLVGAQPAVATDEVPPDVAKAAKGSALEDVRELGRAFAGQDPQAAPLARASDLTNIRRVYVWVARSGTKDLVPETTNRYIGQIVSAGRVVGSVELVQPLSKAGAVETGSIDPADPLAVDLVKVPEGMLVRDEGTAQDVIVDGDKAIPVGNLAAHSDKTASSVSEFAGRLSHGRAEGARIAQEARDRGEVGQLAGSARGTAEGASDTYAAWNSAALAMAALALVLGGVAIVLARRVRKAHDA